MHVLSDEFDAPNASQWEQVVSEPVTLPQVTGIAFIGADFQRRQHCCHQARFFVVSASDKSFSNRMEATQTEMVPSPLAVNPQPSDYSDCRTSLPRGVCN
jgi:hypothetical protein